MNYKEAELLNARLRRAAADCLIDAINLNMQIDKLEFQVDLLRDQAHLLSDAANDVWGLSNYYKGGASSWDVPF